MNSIIFGLVAACSWGASDFAGGLSSRRIGAYLSVFYAEIVGMVFLIAVLLFIQEPLPPSNVLLTSLGAGTIGSFGLLLLYQAMATGHMSLAAPISALMAAVLPIIIDAFMEGIPGVFKLIGFGFALAGVWLISKEGGDSRPHLNRLADLRLPFLSGLGFGMYFVLIHQATQQATLWPMIAARTGGTVLMLIFVLLRQNHLSVKWNVGPIIGATAILDIGGNLFYILAGQAGRLDVAAVLGALYPGGTVFLAWLFLKEGISRSQQVGILATLAAIAFMAI